MFVYLVSVHNVYIYVFGIDLLLELNNILLVFEYVI